MKLTDVDYDDYYDNIWVWAHVYRHKTYHSWKQETQKPYAQGWQPLWCPEEQDWFPQWFSAKKKQTWTNMHLCTVCQNLVCSKPSTHSYELNSMQRARERPGHKHKKVRPGERGASLLSWLKSIGSRNQVTDGYSKAAAHKHLLYYKYVDSLSFFSFPNLKPLPLMHFNLCCAPTVSGICTLWIEKDEAVNSLIKHSWCHGK